MTKVCGHHGLFNLASEIWIVERGFICFGGRVGWLPPGLMLVSGPKKQVSPRELQRQKERRVPSYNEKPVRFSWVGWVLGDLQARSSSDQHGCMRPQRLLIYPA